MEFLEYRQVIERHNSLAAKMQLFKGACNMFQVMNPLDMIASQIKNFEVTQARHVFDLHDCVIREVKFLTVLKLIDLIVKLLDLFRQQASEIDLSGFLRRDAVSFLPSTDCFCEWNSVD